MMTLPNIITLSRIGLIPVFVGLFYLQPGYLEGAPLALINNGTPLPWINNVLVIIFILISASDFVDGLLARKLNQISEFGQSHTDFVWGINISCSIFSIFISGN